MWNDTMVMATLMQGWRISTGQGYPDLGAWGGEEQDQRGIHRSLQLVCFLKWAGEVTGVYYSLHLLACLKHYEAWKRQLHNGTPQKCSSTCSGCQTKRIGAKRSLTPLILNSKVLRLKQLLPIVPQLGSLSLESHPVPYPHNHVLTCLLLQGPSQKGTLPGGSPALPSFSPALQAAY